MFRFVYVYVRGREVDVWVRIEGVNRKINLFFFFANVKNFRF